MANEKSDAEPQFGTLGIYYPDGETGDKCYGLYLRLAGNPVFVDLREDQYLEQRKLKALQLSAHVGELEISLKQFIAAFPIFESRTIEFIGLHSTQLDQREVFWAPTGYMLLRDLSFVAE